MDLIRRVEEASMNAWPANHHLLLDGWLIRLSNGFTKRANCVVPLYHDGAHDQPVPDHIQLDKIRYCENLYAREQLQTVFRLTSHKSAGSLDDLLAERGYAQLDRTQVQVLDLATRVREPATEQQISLVTAPQWLREYGRLARMPDSASELHAGLIRSIRPDCAFALLKQNDVPIACALGVLEHDLLGLFDVITAPEHRSQGHAGILLSQLLDWGQAKGASRAYLQVIEENTPALAVYARLGFRSLYRYWYRQTG